MARIRWRLTPTAYASLMRIMDWTQDNFGPQQAERYKEKLLDRLDDVSEGHAFTRPGHLLTDRERDNSLSYVTAGEHYVVFRRTDEAIEILDFVHSRSDLPQHLHRLNPDPKEI